MNGQCAGSRGFSSIGGVDPRDARRGVGDPVERVRVRDRPDHRRPCPSPGPVCGSSSQTSSPGTLDGIDASSPRISHRGVGLGVERLELAGRAVEEQEDARLRLAEPPGGDRPARGRVRIAAGARRPGRPQDPARAGPATRREAGRAGSARRRAVSDRPARGSSPPRSCAESLQRPSP